MMDTLLLVLSAALLSVICVYLLKISWPILRFLQLANRLPGPNGIAHFKHFINIISSSDKAFQSVCSLVQQYGGGPFRIWIGPKLIVGITNPEDAEILLVKERLLTRDKYVMMGVRKFLGNGLIACRGNIWKEKRRITERAFHGSILPTYVKVFNKNSYDLLNNLQTFSDGRAFDVYPLIGQCTLNGIRDNAIGSDANTDNNHDDTLMTFMMEISHKSNEIFTKPWLLISPLFKMSKLGKEFIKFSEVLYGMSTSAILKKLQKCSVEGKMSEELECRQNTFLDFIITSANDINSPQTLKQLQGDLNNIIIAGQETTATTLSFSLMMLALHPDLQDGIYQELQEVFADDWKRPVTFDDIKSLQNMNRFLKEVLRIISPVPLIPRDVDKEIKLTNYTLPSGCAAWISPYFIHRDPRYYPDPERFDPDRFLPGRVAERPSYSYIPFGAGPRNCVGYKYAELQMSTILAHVLRKYKVLPVFSSEDLQKLEFSIVLKPCCGFQIKIQPRK